MQGTFPHADRESHEVLQAGMSIVAFQPIDC